MMNYLCCGLIGYFIGSLNPSYFIGKAHGVDIREKGSGNSGATNVMMLFGKFSGAFCAVFDILKAFFAIKLVKALFPTFMRAFPIVGTAVILGHLFPFYMNFRGGKGFAALAGTYLAFGNELFLFMLVIAAGILLISNYLCLVPVIGSILLPFIYLIITKDFLGAGIFLIATICICQKHKENLIRISNGTELRFSYLWKPDEEMKRIQKNGGVDDETVKERFLMK